MLCFLLLGARGFRLGPASGPRVHRQLLGLFDDSIDVSPERNGQVLKRIMRKGDVTKGRPVAGDTVYICWKIFDEHGALLHETTPVSSDAQTSASAFAAADQLAATDLPTAEPRIISEADAEPEDFNFCLGATPRQVIRGWEAAVPTMYEGEVAVLSLRPEWAFGAAGVPQLGINPNAPLSTQVELIKIVPSPLRTLDTVGPDERCVEPQQSRCTVSFETHKLTHSHQPLLTHSFTLPPSLSLNNRAAFARSSCGKSSRARDPSPAPCSATRGAACGQRCGTAAAAPRGRPHRESWRRTRSTSSPTSTCPCPKT